MSAVTLLALLLTAQPFETGPVTSFETEGDQPFVASGAKIQRVEEHASDGKFALRVDVPGAAKDTWPGFILRAGDQPDWSRYQLLTMDIWLSGQESIHLSFRLDDLKGANVFGSDRLQPGWNKGWAVNLAGQAAQLDVTRIKQLLLYLRMPRRDATFYVDNVRWGTWAGKYSRIAHLDTTPAATPNADEQRRGFVLFKRPAMCLVYPDSRPGPRLERLEAFAARGEIEPVTLSLHALRELSGVELSVSDLKGPGGKVIPGSVFERRVVECLDKRVVYASNDYLADTPSYLAPWRQVDVGQGVSRTFWLDFTAPRDAAPGVYRGTVEVSAGAGVAAVPLHVRVLPFALPELKGLMYGEYYTTYGKYTDSADGIRADLADMRLHQMTSVGLCFGVENSSYTVEGDQVRFAFKGGTRFEWFMDAYRDLGFREPIVLLSDSGQAAAAVVGKLGDPAYDRVYVAFYKALAEACRQHRWPVIYVQPVDEPGWQSDDERRRNTYLLKLLKAAGIPTEQDGPGDDYFHGEAGPFADLWNYNGNLGPAEVVEAARRAGKLIVSYNNDVESYRPETDRWAYGLFNWRHAMVGGFNWAYRGGAGNVYDPFDAKHGDLSHVLPADAEHPGGPALGWGGSREGVDDRRYLAHLEALIEQGRQAGGEAAKTAQAAAEALAALRRRLDDSPRVRGRAAFEAILSADQARKNGLTVPTEAVKVALGDLKQPNGLTFGEYDAIRWMLAVQASRLLAAMGKGEAVEAPFAPVPVTARLANVQRGQVPGVAVAARPTVQVPTLVTAPVVDGQIDADPGWRDAAQVSLSRSDGAGPTQMPTEVRFGLRDGLLWVAFIAHEDTLKLLTANVTATDGEVWKDDCVEVFLDPGPTSKTYYQVVVNPLGTVARIGAGGRAWRPEVKAAARIDEPGRRWLAELAIPVADLNLAPRFGLNFGRERRPLEVLELSTWSATGGPFGQPDRFGLGVLSGPLPAGTAAKPSLSLALSPGYQLVGDGTVGLRIDSVLPPQVAGAARLTLTVTGGPAPLEVPFPGLASGRLTADLAVGDLPPGDYRVTANLTAGAETLTAAAELTRLPAVCAP